MAGFTSRQNYDDGVTNYAFDAFLSPGHLLGRNTTSNFRPLRQGATSTYAYMRGSVERLYDVDCRTDFLVRVSGQLSTSKLLPTEQLGFGGYNTIRGYDMRTGNGDSGYVLNMEYRRKPIIGCCNGTPTSLILLAFTDFGQQFQYGHVPNNQPDGDILASGGVGARYLIDPNCSLRFDYGVPFTEVGQNFHKSGRVHIGAVFSY